MFTTSPALARVRTCTVCRRRFRPHGRHSMCRPCSATRYCRVCSRARQGQVSAGECQECRRAVFRFHVVMAGFRFPRPTAAELEYRLALYQWRAEQELPLFEDEAA